MTTHSPTKQEKPFILFTFLIIVALSALGAHRFFVILTLVFMIVANLTAKMIIRDIKTRHSPIKQKKPFLLDALTISIIVILSLLILDLAEINTHALVNYLRRHLIRYIVVVPLCIFSIVAINAEQIRKKRDNIALLRRGIIIITIIILLILFLFSIGFQEDSLLLITTLTIIIYLFIVTIFEKPQNSIRAIYNLRSKGGLIKKISSFFYPGWPNGIKVVYLALLLLFPVLSILEPSHLSSLTLSTLLIKKSLYLFINYTMIFNILLFPLSLAYFICKKEQNADPLSLYAIFILIMFIAKNIISSIVGHETLEELRLSESYIMYCVHIFIFPIYPMLPMLQMPKFSQLPYINYHLAPLIFGIFANSIITYSMFKTAARKHLSRQKKLKRK